jgi:Leucine-rich repeat (LRR) protein
MPREMPGDVTPRYFLRTDIESLAQLPPEILAQVLFNQITHGTILVPPRPESSSLFFNRLTFEELERDPLLPQAFVSAIRGLMQEIREGTHFSKQEIYERLQSSCAPPEAPPSMSCTKTLLAMQSELRTLYVVGTAVYARKEFIRRQESLSLKEAAKILEKDLPQLQVLLSHYPEIAEEDQVFFSSFEADLRRFLSRSDPSLDVLRYFPNLKKLDLSYRAEITHDMLADLRHCPALQYLSLRGCWGMGSDALNHLIHCRDMRYLDLTECNITRLGWVTHCPLLETLYLGGFRHDIPDLYPDQFQVVSISEEDLEYLYPCQNLKQLALRDCTSITDHGLKSLLRDPASDNGQRFPHLKHLDLKRTGITNDALEFLQYCPELESLGLLGCNGVSGEGLSNLVHVPHLQTLQLGNTCLITVGNHLQSRRRGQVITDPIQIIRSEDLENLIHCPGLKSLELILCDDITSLTTLRHCPGLEVLKLDCCRTIRNESLESLQYCPGLKFLKLSTCPKIRRGDRDFFQYCPNLEEYEGDFFSGLINCRQLRKLTLAGEVFLLSEHVKNFPNLTHLTIRVGYMSHLNLDNLSACSRLQSLSLDRCHVTGYEALRNFHQLEELTLTGTETTNDHLSHLRACRQLRHLSLGQSVRTQANGLTDAGLVNIEACQTLRSLDLFSAAQLFTDEGIDRFQGQRPNVRILRPFRPQQ